MKIVIVFILILFSVSFFYCGIKPGQPGADTPPTYVGTDKCQNCHKKEYKTYLTSDHFHAMDSAVSQSVKGDFNNSRFIYYGDTAMFYQRGGRYYVLTKDSTGKRTEFLISFTFGYNPLQEYLTRFADGRIQVLPYCWDCRPRENGGQKWFHIYNKEKILPHDELYWTGINQNWNNMCADCHTTNFYKKFNEGSNSFSSTWSEAKVSCESCHGPASGHLQWADTKSDDSLKGFAISLRSPNVGWKWNDEKGIAYPDKIVQNDVLIETCARCHAHAVRLSDDYHYGQSLLQTHKPSTINTINYYVDGQIKEEDYEYGSFLQSKMYAVGVTCINCHDAHSMQIKASGNAVCFTCHSPAKFYTPQHTFHSINSSGSQCVSCHMPVTNFMVIDARRDHSIRIPRPDLSLTTGAPNACNKCHGDKPAGWAAKYFLQWYGTKLPKEKTYGELLYIVSKKNAGSEAALYTLLTSKNYPDIIKATALEHAGDFGSPRLSATIKDNLQSSDPNLRLNAVQAATSLQPEVAISAVTPLLNDKILSVRMEALNALAPFYANIEAAGKSRFNEVLEEYLAVERNLSDRPEGYLNRGSILTQAGRTAEAEQIYLMGIKRFPSFIPLYANMADFYRATNAEGKAYTYLQKGLVIEPNNASLHYSLALWQVRNKNQPAAQIELLQAVRNDPSNPNFTYANAVMAYSTGNPQLGVQVLEAYTAKYGNDATIINDLISLYEAMHQVNKLNYYVNLRKSVFGY